MRCLKYKLPRLALARIYTSRVRPAIEYANVIYDNCPINLSNRLESVQMEAARICTGALRQTRSSNILTELGWELLITRRKWHKLVYLYKMAHNLTPPYLSNLCPPTIASISRYPTRNSNSLRVPRCRTSCFQTSFLPSTIRHWNGLSIEIRNSPSLSIFKTILKKQFSSTRPPIYYSTGHRKASICHTRLRMGMSQLNAHLFPYSLSESPDCSCGSRESIVHYFFECPHYAAQRYSLLVSVRNIIAPNVSYAMLPALDQVRFLSILLSGSEDLNEDENVIIFKSVHNFIIKTERF